MYSKVREALCKMCHQKRSINTQSTYSNTVHPWKDPEKKVNGKISAKGSTEWRNYMKMWQ